MVIDLQITKDVNNIVTVVWDDINLVDYCHDRDWSSIGNLIIKDVPAAIEYEVSKYIFNKVEIAEMNAHNLQLLIQIKEEM